MEDENTNSIQPATTWDDSGHLDFSSMTSQKGTPETNIKKLQELVSSLAIQVADLNNKTNVADSKNKTLSSKLGQQNAKLEKLKLQLIEGLGLFVAFITFISASVTFLSKVENMALAIFFIFSILFCMLFFVYALAILTDILTEENRTRFSRLVATVALVAIVMYVGMWCYERNLPDIIKKISKREQICINCKIDKEGNIIRPSLLLKPSPKQE